jgi:2,4-dienoyl-CoA reductase-like NADH-dependent reductase (Old Yellow Enzyme family)
MLVEKLLLGMVNKLLEENGWITVAPSEIPYLEGERTPHALTKSEISELVNAFKEAAVRSVKAGFDVIEIHAAHGYLILSFYLL